MKEGKINHDTGEDIKKDVCDVITQWIELPEMIIDSITQDPNGLVSGSLLKSKDLKDISPVEAFNLSIAINHRIIPVCE